MEIEIKSRCLDCAESFVIRMRDGIVLTAEPATIVGHLNTSVPRWGESWPHT
jgi:hypothetical protein